MADQSQWGYFNPTSTIQPPVQQEQQAGEGPTQVPLAETQPDGYAESQCHDCQNEESTLSATLADFIRSQIQGRRQFIWDEMDDLDRHERSLDDPAVIKTLELIDEYTNL